MTLQSLKNLAANGSRVAMIETINHYFDAMYVPAVLLMGPYVGGAVMTVGAIALNYVFVRIYNGSPSDWYGFEWMRAKLSTGKLWYAAAAPYFLFWCWWDPFAAFILARGKQEAGYRFKLADWAMLSAITAFGSTIWTLMMWGGIEVIKRVIF